MKYVKVVPFLFTLITLLGCGNNESASGLISSVLPDQMAGCYATEKDKPSDIKIDKDSGKYYASFLEKDTWKKEQEPLVAVTASDIEKMFGKNADKVDVALAYPEGAFALFKFKPNANLEGKDPDSDYMAFIFIGAGSVFKSPCQ